MHAMLQDFSDRRRLFLSDNGRIIPSFFSGNSPEGNKQVYIVCGLLESWSMGFFDAVIENHSLRCHHRCICGYWGMPGAMRVGRVPMTSVVR